MIKFNRADRCVQRIGMLFLFLVGLLLAGGIAGCGLLTGGMVPATPTDLSVTDGAFLDRVRLTWSPVPEAGGYEVWKASTTGGEYTYVASTAYPSYDDTAVVPGTAYWYKVRACNRAGCSEFTEARSGRAKSPDVPSVPTGLSASQGTLVDRVRITWQAAPRATGYSLYRATDAAGPFTLIVEVDGTQYEDVDVVLGQTYWYKLRACSSAGCSVLSGGAPGYASSQVPAAPQGVSATDGTEAGKVIVIWEELPGATSYLVYRADAEDGVPTLLESVTGTSHDDTAVQAGTTYWYRVRACNASGCGPLSDADSGSPGANGEEPPPPPTTSL